MASPREEFDQRKTLTGTGMDDPSFEVDIDGDCFPVGIDCGRDVLRQTFCVRLSFMDEMIRRVPDRQRMEAICDHAFNRASHRFLSAWSKVTGKY